MNLSKSVCVLMKLKIPTSNKETNLEIINIFLRNSPHFQNYRVFPVTLKHIVKY